MQIEASGDVGTLFHLLETMGIHGWRDMNQDDLTESGMRQGVYDSDVFVLFLTNSVLSRPYCLMEVKWAIEFGKPILIVVEQEERFFAFDIERWKCDECTKGSDGKWERSAPDALISNYAACDPFIKDLIREQDTARLMMPFRRREFEVNALAREIVRRSSARVRWGQTLPPSPAFEAAKVDAIRRVCLIHSDAPCATRIAREVIASLSDVSPRLTWTSEVAGNVYASSSARGAATHALVLLSKNVLDAGSASLALISEATALGLSTVYLYIEPGAEGEGEGWDFGAFYQRPPSDIKAAIARNEALKFRFATPATLRYEHDALMLELLRRMRVEVGEGAATSVIAAASVARPQLESPPQPIRRQQTGEELLTK